MLRIKSEVDLKELEKYGFEFYDTGSDDKNDYDEEPYYKNQIQGFNCKITVGIFSRSIGISTFCPIFTENLDVLFDLISAGLVEKVN